MARKNKRNDDEDIRDIWEGLDPETDLDVNEADLIGEMLRQSTLHFNYSRLVSIAEEEMNFAAEVVKSTRSQIILEVNRDPSIIGVSNGKPSVNAIEAYYREHVEYKGAKEVYLKSQGVYHQLMAAVYALGHKKDMLMNLARYELAGLISNEPRLPADASESEKEALKERIEQGAGKSPRRKMRGVKKEQ